MDELEIVPDVRVVGTDTLYQDGEYVDENEHFIRIKIPEGIMSFNKDFVNCVVRLKC